MHPSSQGPTGFKAFSLKFSTVILRTVIAVGKGDEDLVSYLSGLIGTLTAVKYYIVAFYFFHKITFHSYFLYNRTITIHLKHFQNLTKIYVLYMEMTHTRFTKL